MKTGDMDTGSIHIPCGGNFTYFAMRITLFAEADCLSAGADCFSAEDIKANIKILLKHVHLQTGIGLLTEPVDIVVWELAEFFYRLFKKGNTLN